jgi:hypothetical protein
MKKKSQNPNPNPRQTPPPFAPRGGTGGGSVGIGESDFGISRRRRV